MAFNPDADFNPGAPVYAKPSHTSPKQTPPEVLALRPGAVYRHFKGDYYVVRSVDCDSEDASKKRVSYQSIKPPYESWSRPVEDFLSPVPEGRYSPTGQSMRFQLVTDLHEYPLSGVPTELLAAELKKREDNPYRNEDGASRVLLEDYVVGRVTPPMGEGDRAEFDILSSFDNEDQATDWADRHPISKRGIVCRRVFYRLAMDR